MGDTNAYTLEAQSDLPGVAYAAMRQMILAHAKGGGLTVLEDADGRLTVKTAHGLIGLRPGVTCDVAGMVAAADVRWLFVLKTAVTDQMRRALPQAADAIRWSDGDVVGALPPNFAFVRVTDVTPLGPVFLRATLQGEDLSSYGDSAIHFRLVLPAPQTAGPHWPTVAANGSILWPDGPNAPHRPVYTARLVDHGRNSLVTDIFVHPGGRTTEWAQDLMANNRARQVIGLVGPSGGGLMLADHVLMASDETGFPAAARILENLPDTARGEVLLEAEYGSDCDYPIEAPPGVDLIWLARSRGDHLGRATLDRLADHPGAKVWFAGERAQATEVRSTAKAQGWEAGDLRVSGFWTRAAG